MYSEFLAEPDLQRAIIFHGHFCPGLAVGYRAAMLALERLAPLRRAEDELVAIVDNKSCAADAIQCLTGCTFGKTNFIFRDLGKHEYTLVLQPSGRAAQVKLRGSAQEAGASEERDAWVNWVLAAPSEEVFEVRLMHVEVPVAQAVAAASRCATCGQPVLELGCQGGECEKRCVDCRPGQGARVQM